MEVAVLQDFMVKGTIGAMPGAVGYSVHVHFDPLFDDSVMGPRKKEDISKNVNYSVVDKVCRVADRYYMKNREEEEAWFPVSA
jgi:hypothetical protein